MQLTGHDLFLTTFFVLATYLWMPPAWLLMRFATPKGLVQRYFKKPHFTDAELALFNHFPGSLMRTGILMNLCVWPHRGKKRQMTDIRCHVASWYINVSRWFVYSALVHFVLIISLLLILIFFSLIQD